MRLSLPILGGFLAALLLLAGCGPSAKSSGPSPPVVSEMNRGVSLMGQYQYDDAVKAFEKVVKADPGLADARVNLAIALFNRNGKEDLGAAGRQLAEVLRQDPGNVRALYFQAILFQHQGKADQAVPCLEKVVQQRPEDGAAWYVLALCRQRLNQPAEADFLKAVQYRPYLYSAYYQLYQAAMRSGQEAKAREYMERFKALRESPLGETIELPQYNQMGELALARPYSPPSAVPAATRAYQLEAPRTVVAWPNPGTSGSAPSSIALGGAAAGDLNGDGQIDLVLPTGPNGRVALLRQGPPGTFLDATRGSGLESITEARSCSLGDFDNDDRPDLFITTAGGGHLFKGKGDGTFTEVTAGAGMDTDRAPGASALFLDADHDGDLDVFVCSDAANQLWNNNGNGLFTNIAARTAVACANGGTVLVLPGDLDGDRDMDLVLLRQDQPAKVLLNDLLGQYREADLHGTDIRGEVGAVLQDFDGDGPLDLLVLGGTPRALRLFVGDGHGGFSLKSDSGDNAMAAVGEPLKGFRVADLDLDGDLDVVALGSQLHFLLNDGRGHFVSPSPNGQAPVPAGLTGIEVLDVSGDLVPDVVFLVAGATNTVAVATGKLTPPSTALAIQPSGIRGRDGRTRSPASGFGTTFTTRVGLDEHRRLYTGQYGGANQSLLPVVLGLGGAAQADYVDLLWPDGVAQTEMDVAAGTTHRVAELQRKISSCPVLFAWNGRRFEFVTDFAGVGGLGYFAAPGVSAPPQVLEQVKIEPGQLQARAGRYELRVTEPMEETAYIDRLELLAVDHPPGAAVFPDERLAINGPAPTHDLLTVERPILPIRAQDRTGRDCLRNLERVDRRYGYEPQLDRRYVGFCAPHTLELDFGDRLAGLDAQDRVFLFIHGFIEYPYSQTVYAASQSHIGWEPIRVDAQDPEGAWRTIVPDGGAPGGMARMMTIELTGRLGPAARRLRLTTNLEVFYDQVFVARTATPPESAVHRVPLREATLRYLGFPREYSPDGRLPWIYDYDACDPTAPFHKLNGLYTRYGAVEEVLKDFDDAYVLVGPGDEIKLSFDATAVPPTPPGQVRSFILVSHAYCKDMDLYTATPQTLEPLPFKSMSQYPYPAGEKYPDTERHRRYRAEYNTRRVE